MRFPTSAQIWTAFAVITAPVAADLGLRGLHRQPIDPVWSVEGGDAERGRETIARYGCGSCHVIPGLNGADGRVGPRLNGIREQVYVAGVVPNGPENLAAWIRNPQGIDPQTAMPNLGVEEAESRDIAAYLLNVD